MSYLLFSAVTFPYASISRALRAMALSFLSSAKTPGMNSASWFINVGARSATLSECPNSHFSFLHVLRLFSRSLTPSYRRIMAESLNRKACDRCHDQKLSCKRIGDGICDRCLRLNAECRSSPSLRYKKQIQHYDQTQDQKQQLLQQPPQPEPSQAVLQHHQSGEVQQQQNPRPRVDYSKGPSATSQSTLNMETNQHSGAQPCTERRSPKRRRTGSEAHPVLHDTGKYSQNSSSPTPGIFANCFSSKTGY